MSIDIIKENFKEASNLLNKFSSNQQNFEKIKKAGDLMVCSLRNKNKLFSCGNGGSMADAMHFAEELTGRFRNTRQPLAAIAIADPAHITCIANDFGFEYVFSKYIEANGINGDILLAISTSGNSLNIINAAKTAKQKQMKVIALSGNDGGALSANCDIEIRVPWDEYSDRIQEIHIKIIHSLIHYVEAMFLNQ